jgi:hypothetical protein
MFFILEKLLMIVGKSKYKSYFSRKENSENYSFCCYMDEFESKSVSLLNPSPTRK